MQTHKKQPTLSSYKTNIVWHHMTHDHHHHHHHPPRPYFQLQIMKTRTWVLHLSLFAILISISHAKQTQPISKFLFMFDHQAKPQDDTDPKLEPSMVLAAIFCFMAASISSAGGIGGGGLYVPILTIVAGLNLKTASSLSAFMVTGGSLANVMCNLFMKSSRFGGRTLIDFDIALLSEPCMLLGVSVGVICNVVFPEWLITILFAVFLVWSTFKTCKNGVSCWRYESEEGDMRNGFGCLNLENGKAVDVPTSGNEEVKGMEEPLLGKKINIKVANNQLVFPWNNVGVLILVWFSFLVLYLVRGNRYGQGFVPVEPCGVAYWLLSSIQIPVAIIFTAWILLRKENCRYQSTYLQDNEDLARAGTQNKLIFPLMALMAGMLGGVFGIGGGMLISPLLLHVGVSPEITAATCSFMVFFSSIMSAFQYLLLGMEHLDTALILSVICFIASLVGLLLIHRAITMYGRASLIVFSVGIVMALSAVLMTSFGAIDVWRDYESGRNMGFKPPC